MKKEIVKILNEYLNELTHDNFTRGIIYEENIEDIAEDVEKFYNSHFVIVPNSMVCPKCKSEYVYYWVKDKVFECDDCNEQWQTAL